MDEKTVDVADKGMDIVAALPDGMVLVVICVFIVCVFLYWVIRVVVGLVSKGNSEEGKTWREIIKELVSALNQLGALSAAMEDIRDLFQKMITRIEAQHSETERLHQCVDSLKAELAKQNSDEHIRRTAGIILDEAVSRFPTKESRAIFNEDPFGQ